MSVDQNKAAVQRAIEIFDTLDANALEEVFTPELAAGWREVMHTLPFSEHRIKITDMVAEGDQVAIRVETRGVHSGEWEGVPSTGKSWTNRGMGLVRVEDGKIIELEFIFDELGHLKQLGAPSPRLLDAIDGAAETDGALTTLLYVQCNQATPQLVCRSPTAPSVGTGPTGR